MGRHSEYDEAIGDEIVRLYSEGRTLMEICEMEGMPSRPTITRWQERFPAFRSAFEQAREDHVEATVDQIQVIADTERDPQRARNRMDARKFRASKLRPEKYGDRLDVNVNQTVSVSLALDEARRRARPISDLTDSAQHQVVDTTYEILPKPADAQSVAQVLTKQGPALGDPEPAASQVETPLPPSIFD